jgi:hypothetical protein
VVGEPLVVLHDVDAGAREAAQQIGQGLGRLAQWLDGGAGERAFVGAGGLAKPLDPEARALQRGQDRFAMVASIAPSPDGATDSTRPSMDCSMKASRTTLRGTSTVCSRAIDSARAGASAGSTSSR